MCSSSPIRTRARARSHRHPIVIPRSRCDAAKSTRASDRHVGTARAAHKWERSDRGTSSLAARCAPKSSVRGRHRHGRACRERSPRNGCFQGNRRPSTEAPSRFVLDFSEPARRKRGLLLAHESNGLQPSFTAGHPCPMGAPNLIRGLRRGPRKFPSLRSFKREMKIAISTSPHFQALERMKKARRPCPAQPARFFRGGPKSQGQRAAESGRCSWSGAGRRGHPWP